MTGAIVDPAPRDAVIYHGRYLATLDGSRPPVEPESGVLVERGRVTAIDTLAELSRRAPGAALVGGRDYVVLPGLVDAHQHGRAITPAASGVLDEPLETWLLEQRGRPRPEPYLAARVAGIRLLLAGVTTAAHPHIAPAGDAFAEHTLATARGLRDAGLRVSFGIDVKDRATYTYDADDEFFASLPPDLRRALHDAPHAAPPTLAELDALLELLRTELDGSLVDVAIAPRGPQWCGPEALEWVAGHAGLGTHVHTHCAETRAQYGYFALRGTSPVRHLDASGLLRPNVTLAHAVWLDEDDVAVIASTGVRLSHNPSSNLRLASGVAPVAHLRRRGVEPGIGSDSAGPGGDAVDLFAEARLARHLEQLTRGPDDAPLAPLARLQVAMAAGRDASGHPEPSGRLAVSGPGDVVLLDWEAMTAGMVAAAADDAPASTLASRARASHVSDVVVGGRHLVSRGRYRVADLESLEDELLSNLLGTRSTADETLVRRLRPHVEAATARYAAAGGPFATNAAP